MQFVSTSWCMNITLLHNSLYHMEPRDSRCDGKMPFCGYPYLLVECRVINVLIVVAGSHMCFLIAAGLYCVGKCPTVVDIVLIGKWHFKCPCLDSR